METIINILKRLLNPGDLERLGKKLNINIDLKPLYKSIIAALVPLGGDYLYKYINTSIKDFREKPTADILADLKQSGQSFKWVEDFTVNLFGHKIVLAEAETQTNNKTAIMYGLLIVGGLFLLARR